MLDFEIGLQLMHDNVPSAPRHMNYVLPADWVHSLQAGVSRIGRRVVITSTTRITYAWPCVLASEYRLDNM